MLLSAVYVQPATAAEFQKQLTEARRHRLQGEIGIFYDPFDAVISQTARDVSTALDMANVSSSLHEVSSAFELEVLLNETGVWIAIYLFNSGLESISLGREVVGWEDFAQILLRYKGVHHILGIGNTRKLAEFVGEGSRNIHLANTDLVDAELAFLYSLWAVAEVLESTRGYRYREAELDIRRVGLKFFADNFNDLFERTLEPKVPLGEEDLVQKQKDFEEMKNRFPNTVQELPPVLSDGATLSENSSSTDASNSLKIRLLQTLKDGATDTSEQTSSATTLSTTTALEDAASGDLSSSDLEEVFKLLNIPTKSGLDGPIGSVVDFLIKVLIEVGGYTAAAVDSSLINDIKKVVEGINAFVGLVQGFSGESALRAIFNVMKQEFPVLEDYGKYFDLFIEGLEVFRERNDMGKVLDFVLRALGVVFSDVASGISNLVQTVLNVLSQLIDVGTDLYDRIRDSDNVFNAVLSWFNEKLMGKVAAKFLNETASALGWNVTEKWGKILEGVEKIVGTVNAAIDFLINGNSTRLVEIIDEEVFKAFQLDSIIGEDNVERIKTVIKLVASVLGYSEPTIDLLKELLGKSLSSVRYDIVRLAYEKLGNKYIFAGGRVSPLYPGEVPSYAGIYPNDFGKDEGQVWLNWTGTDGKKYGMWKFEITETMYDVLVERIPDWVARHILVKEAGRYYVTALGYVVRDGKHQTLPDLVWDNGRWKMTDEGTREIFFDCAGLVYYVYREAGLSFGDWNFYDPSVADPWGLDHLLENYNLEMIAGPENLQPGDLVRKTGHIGIYVGQDVDDPSKVAVIHALNPEWGVVKSTYSNVQSLTTEEDYTTVPPTTKWETFARVKLPALQPSSYPPQSALSGQGSTVYSSASTLQDSAESTQSMSDALATQIMSDIKDAVEEGQRDVTAFKNQILTHINEALTRAGIPLDAIADSRKQFIVDAITLTAGLMNQNFEKSALPTLGAVFNKQLSNLYVPDVPFLDDLAQTLDKTVNVVLGIVAVIKEDTNMKQALTGVVEQFGTQYGQPVDILENLAKLSLSRIGLTDTEITNLRSKIETVATIGQTVFQLWKSYKENGVQGLMQTLLMGTGYSAIHYFANQFNLTGQFNLELYTSILKAVFPRIMGVKPPTPEQIADIVRTALDEIPDSEWHADWPAKADIVETVRTITTLAIDAEDIFSDGFRWIFNQIMDWLAGKVEELADDLLGGISQKLADRHLFHLGGAYELGLGSFTSFGIKFDLAIDAGVNIRTEELFRFVSDIIFQGYDWESGSIEDVFTRILSFVEIIPLFKGSLELGGFGSNANPFMNTLLESLGVEMQFSGGGHFTIQLLSFKGGAFERSGFLKVIEWGFYFTIEISRDFTLFDFLTGGVGGGALNKLAEYIGLDGIVITVFFGLTVEIIKRAASPMGPEQATFTLIIEIGVALTIGISILIASIEFFGELKVVFTFIQDLLGDTPLQIFMDLVARIKVTIELLFIDIKVKWGPKTLYHHDFTAGNKAAAKGASETMGVDTDDDGLSDEYEKAVPGLRWDNPDSDGDGLTDKEESYTTKTDPINPDTDGDGLNDYEEIYIHKTHPKRADTDYDGLNDYEEVTVYGTKPTVMDTDEDGLDDYYEVNHVWDISNVTTSVKEVWIGGVAYNDHTDPLDPDTDEDGLLDGEEGPAGPYYGLEDLYNKTAAEEGEIDKDPLIFNYGYTHPLDNDTDDDSYLQLWDGSKALKGDNVFLRSMTDGEEVKGIWVTFITEGEPNRTLVRTNPCNPDTDGDTGRTLGEVPIDAYLNSDGYELSLNPPTDPTNGDTDHDGLIDGLEGVLAKGSRHTNPNNPDTDGDGLGDMQEILLGTDPRNADTDFDLVLDGEEYHRFHTDPHLADSDYDGLEDYEELFFWHSNPNLRDSDADGISDGQEVLKYDTDPMDEDTDNDGLTDYDEIFKHGTDPFNPDTDRDGLRDYEEAKIYFTDPLNWDTDGDSILYPNEYGEMTWPMSDGDEVFKFQTDPARTDTDNDGLSDSIELYLGSGRIPRSVLEPIPLNSTNNDTDGDGLLDGVELRIGNTTSIIYPYLALMPYSYYNTSVLIADTDRDGLSDFEEVNGTLPSDRSFEAGVAKFNYTGSMPYLWDTDNDTLSDGDEVFYHGTDPARADTDGDGLADNEEVTLTGVMVGYGTSALNPDTDGDLLPDGYEMDPDIIGNVAQKHGINLDPLNADANNNGILDGYEIDLDNDGLSDGEEFFIYNTYESWKKGSAFAGGFLNSDSDGDGLSDGVEVNEFGTNPVKYDTDGDGYSDGAEVAVGTDPLQFTSPEEYEQALNIFRAGKVIRIVYPKNTTLSDITADVRVVNSTLIDTMWFRYNDGTGWSSNYTLQYDAANMQWEYADIIWPEGSYWIQVFGNKTTGYIVWDQQWFTIHIEEEEIPFFTGWSIKILSPANTTIYDKYVDVRVVNATEVVNMWFRYDSGAGWLGNYTLQYNSATQEWENTTVIWPEGPYRLQVFAFTTSGNVIWDEQWFTIAVEKVELGWIEIMSPANTTILDTSVDVLVVNSTVVDAMWFRYDSGEGWSNNYTLNYNSANQRWENITIVWPEGSYHLQVFAARPDEEVLSDEEWFTIYVEKPVKPPFQLYLLVLGVVIGGAGTSASFVLLQRRKRSTEMRKGRGASKKGGE